MAGGATGVGANQAANFVGRNGGSPGGGASKSGVVKVGPGLHRGIVEQILDFLTMDVLVGVPLTAFVLVGATSAVFVFSNSS